MPSKFLTTRQDTNHQGSTLMFPVPLVHATASVSQARPFPLLIRSITYYPAIYWQPVHPNIGLLFLSKMTPPDMTNAARKMARQSHDPADSVTGLRFFSWIKCSSSSARRHDSSAWPFLKTASKLCISRQQENQRGKGSKQGPARGRTDKSARPWALWASPAIPLECKVKI